MTVSAPASEVQKNFGVYHDRALAGDAVRVTKYGRETVVMISAKTFDALKQAQRVALAASDLSDAEAEALEKATIPVAQRYELDR